ncbi:gamma-glutamyltransferase family protein [Denitrobaculum tricleocarpae]|uniref:Gamma-glutamyltransferase family protein n=1 Tax=Denitrobaculum tricleocarpae TaxID=2591009 RepID=A0A545TYG0_9PROT|nr:gamma-glutamyltransferase family protein [Denitrobaculum tricleocarpae]TQV82260.1 gamma-glutamyltransferase family protein [Denitrobaculum tricleocarpae]
MLHTTRAYGGMLVAPHHLAAQAGQRVLAEGGNAIEAMVAAAAAIAVVYPHMNSLGGDNFWLIHEPGEAPIGIDACGGAAELASIDFYREQGLEAIPGRGPLAALTVAGALSGWEAALAVSKGAWDGRFLLPRLLEDAIAVAREGIAVTASQAANTAAKKPEMGSSPGFAETYCPDGSVPRTGDRFRQARLAASLEVLAKEGLESFYRGDLARSLASDLEAAGSPLRLSDLEGFKARRVHPLSVEVAGHRVFNMPPPTQGLASLMLLGIAQHLDFGEPGSFDFIHGLLEATKRAFLVRDRHVTDPDYMTVDPASFLTPEVLREAAGDIDPVKAMPWPAPANAGDTVWLGAIDREGRAVSFIQSTYWEFGSGVVLPESGIVWQNRGTSFSLDRAHHNHLLPGRRPFHTIQPALAQLSDGRVMTYGTMGGEGQPQTQAMLFARHVLMGQDLQETVTAPRWLLGRTWGSEHTNVRMEDRFDPEVIAKLKAAGHDIELVGAFDEIMGHAGALVHHPDGLIEGAADPRSDGQARGF